MTVKIYGRSLLFNTWLRLVAKQFAVAILASCDADVKVIAIETYDGEGIDGARIKEDVVITKGYPELISKFPCHELISCGCKY